MKLRQSIAAIVLAATVPSILGCSVSAGSQDGYTVPTGMPTAPLTTKQLGQKIFELTKNLPNPVDGILNCNDVAVHPDGSATYTCLVRFRNTNMRYLGYEVSSTGSVMPLS